MSTTRRHKKGWTSLLHIFCVALLMSLSFAHRPVSADQLQQDAAYAEEYRLPDGTFADICLGSHQDDTSNHQRHGALLSVCEACILASSILLPDSTDHLLSLTGRRSDTISWLLTASVLSNDPIGNYFARAPPKIIER